jgi:hypothetical protein
MPDDTTTAPLSDEVTPAVELLLAAIYACAGRLDKDELTDDAGEPLRIIGNEIECILDLDVQLDQNALLERGQEYAEAGGLGLAHAVDFHIMPTTAVRDRLDDVDIAELLADHRHLVWQEPGEVFECLGCDYQIPGDEVTDTSAYNHQAAVIRAALLGEATR